MLKCLLLFSGGLDSILAAKILQKRNIKVTGLAIASYFFNTNQAKESAKTIGINLIEKNFSRQHLKIIKTPKCGYGSGMNPCIDCHAFMLREARKISKKEKFDILATGEVLGQRPFSQNKQAFVRIEKLARLKGEILRPLSAKLLDETIYEKEGIIKKEQFEDIEGRSRKKQTQLARELGIGNYPSPSGGCLLTEKEFSIKLKNLLKNTKKQKGSDFMLIRIGRHFWMNGTHIVLGRNKEDNDLLEKLAEENDLIIKPRNFKGPNAFIRGKTNEEIKNEAQILIKKYSKNVSNHPDFICI